jgi:hypothetical protein
MIELLGDVGHVECCFGLIGDRVSIGVGEVHDLYGTFKAQKSFWTHPMVHLVETRFGPFGDTANLDAR